MQRQFPLVFGVNGLLVIVPATVLEPDRAMMERMEHAAHHLSLKLKTAHLLQVCPKNKVKKENDAQRLSLLLKRS